MELDDDDDDDEREEEEEDMVLLLPTGDDDSFEDANGQPRHKFLFQYATHRICAGQYTQNDNGVELPRTVATSSELAAFYCENDTLIQTKRDKYRHYNDRVYNTQDTDFTGARGNNALYAQHIKPQLELHIRKYNEAEAEKQRQTTGVSQQQQQQSTGKKPRKIKSTPSDDKPPPPHCGKDRVLYIQNAIRSRTLRLEHVNDEKELCDYFTYHVRGQDKSIRVIAHELFMVKLGACGGGDQCTEPTSSSSPSIASILTSGTSGTGKSELIKLIRPLFHMEPGGANASCFVELCFGNITNVSHCSAITGPGPGYADADKPCLVDHLCAAADFIRGTGRNDDADDDDDDDDDDTDTDKRRKRKVVASTTGETRPPQVIVLFIDELCKAKADVGILNTFNSLLSAGVMQRASGNITFRLPTGVTLLFYATANFGTDALMRGMLRGATGHNHNAAKTRIIDDMRSRKMQECDIARLGEIVPFFPLSMTEAHGILRFNVDSFFEGHAFSMEKADRDRLVEFYLAGNYVYAHGMHQVCRKINKELRFHVQSLFVKSNRAATGTLQFIVLPYALYGASTDTLMSDDYPDIRRALSDETNAENLSDGLQACADLGYFKLISNGGTASYINIVLSQITTDATGEDNLYGDGDDGDDTEIERLRRDNQSRINREKRVLTLINAPAFKDSVLAQRIRHVCGNDSSSDEEEEEENDKKRKRKKTRSKKHKKTKRNGNYKCPGCDQVYADESVFIKPYKRKNADGGTPTKHTRCTLCKECRR